MPEIGIVKMDNPNEIDQSKVLTNVNPDELAQLETILEFHVASGVDICLEESPQDRFVESKKLAAKQAKIASNPKKTPVTLKQKPEPVNKPKSESGTVSIPDQAAVQSAQELAKSAKDLDELRGMLESFNGCNLKLTAKKLCFADGNPESRVMFIGEAPGRDEDIQGKPFVGRSGQLLDKMLNAIGFDRTNVYITNIVPWRPPGNRSPSTHEIAVCKPFILRQIELVNPEFLVLLGGPSAQNIIGESMGILKMRGKWKSYNLGGREIPCMAMLHPAYLLRQPEQKRLAWRDMLSLKEEMNKKG